MWQVPKTSHSERANVLSINVGHVTTLVNQIESGVAPSTGRKEDVTDRKGEELGVASPHTEPCPTLLMDQILRSIS